MNKLAGVVTLLVAALAGCGPPAERFAQKLVIIGFGGTSSAEWRSFATGTQSGTGEPFWITAGSSGVRSSILTVPGTFPPTDIPNGEMLSGLPLPDIRDTSGTYSYLASDFNLTFERSVAQSALVGPRNPRAPEQELQLPVTITWNHEARTTNIDVNGRTIHLAEGQWSKWIPLDFRVNWRQTIHGMAQFYLIDAGQHLQVYVSPINWHPAQPPAPISSPASLAADLFQRLGPYRTLGAAGPAVARDDHRISAQVFEEDLDRAFDDRAAIILNRLDARRWDLLVGVLDIDRPGKTEEFIAQVRQRLTPETKLLMVSGGTKIVDFAPTVLKYFGLPIPTDMDGQPIF